MRLAVVSDIHSNLEAFQAVLADISKQSVDHIISLGDNIGYGAQPEEVVAVLKRYAIPSVLGNHEMALLDKGCLAALNPFARKALAVTRDRLSTRAKKYISTFKPFILRYGCRFVHGVPPDSFSGYLFKMPDHGLIRIMEGIYQRITFSGHTHQLKIYELYQGNLGRKTFVKLTVLLAKTRRYIINCGSVGQPRDCCNKAKYIIWDSTANTVTPRFVSYDYHRAANKIRQAGIPEIYADQLENPIF